MITTSDLIYHIYPLGMLNCPPHNDRTSPPQPKLKQLESLIPHLQELGVTAIYLGPVFESSTHGYDTVDYRLVDRRLGTNQDLTDLVARMHDANIRVILDAVLNHTGRDFFAFRDLAERKHASPYADWYKGVDFTRDGPARDGFAYEGWSGHHSLAKLNTDNREARKHLLSAVTSWIHQFDIDGLRLDAADVIEHGFLDELSRRCKECKRDFWLVGEVVHGDYSHWAKPGRLDSVTNYELYKGLWSCHNDANYFEIAWTLNRQWGPEGLYKGIPLYSFADNHDVPRVASSLMNSSHLYTLYGLLFTTPGVPSIYYGSEWGIRGHKDKDSDQALRPPISGTDPSIRFRHLPIDSHPETDPDALYRTIARFARLRREEPALRSYRYRQVLVTDKQIVFERGEGSSSLLVAVNADSKPAHMRIADAAIDRHIWKDILNGEEITNKAGGLLELTIPPSWLRVLGRAR